MAGCGTMDAVEAVNSQAILTFSWTFSTMPGVDRTVTMLPAMDTV